jgi:predicted RNase H-related nuclease YkuK (DUF458 family)
MHIIVMTLIGKKISLDVEPSDTIENVKMKIFEEESLSTEMQKLVFGGEFIDMKSLFVGSK